MRRGVVAGKVEALGQERFFPRARQISDLAPARGGRPALCAQGEKAALVSPLPADLHDSRVLQGAPEHGQVVFPRRGVATQNAHEERLCRVDHD